MHCLACSQPFLALGNSNECSGRLSYRKPEQLHSRYCINHYDGPGPEFTPDHQPFSGILRAKCQTSLQIINLLAAYCEQHSMSVWIQANQLPLNQNHRKLSIHLLLSDKDQHSVTSIRGAATALRLLATLTSDVTSCILSQHPVTYVRSCCNLPQIRPHSKSCHVRQPCVTAPGLVIVLAVSSSYAGIFRFPYSYLQYQVVTLVSSGFGIRLAVSSS